MTNLMTSTKHLKSVGSWMLHLLAAVIIPCGCLPGRYNAYHSVYGTVSLVSHPAAFAALRRDDLAGARRILEARLTVHPNDAELNYTLGCVDLVQSEDPAETSNKRILQARGWQRVEAASGKLNAADSLLAHAYLVGRWGKRSNHDLYVQHLHLTLNAFQPPGKMPEDINISQRTWALLTPP